MAGVVGVVAVAGCMKGLACNLKKIPRRELVLEMGVYGGRGRKR